MHSCDTQITSKKLCVFAVFCIFLFLSVFELKQTLCLCVSLFSFCLSLFLSLVRATLKQMQGERNREQIYIELKSTRNINTVTNKHASLHAIVTLPPPLLIARSFLLVISHALFRCPHVYVLLSLSLFGTCVLVP